MSFRRVLVVDDEPLARQRLVAFLERRSDVEAIEECRDGEEAIRALREKPDADLLLLDIQMPGRGAFEVIEAIGVARLPPVVFVTAFDEYALAAFDVHAVDYLLKPFDEERLDQAVERARRRREADDLQAVRHRLDSVVEALGANRGGGDRTAPRHVAVEKGDRTRLVPTDRIDWIEAEGNYVRVHTREGDAYLVRTSLKGVEEQFAGGRLLRIHRSYLVNPDRVREIQHLFGGRYQVVLEDGTQLPLSRRYRRKLPRLGAGS